MDTLPSAAQDTTSEVNPNSVKSDDDSSSLPNDRGSDSPPPHCAICLGTCRNKSFTDSCLHQFCFKCLLTWSKVKTECPLCKQIFRSIIHNVQSNFEYEEYMVEQNRGEETLELSSRNNLFNVRRYRFRATIALPIRESLAIQEHFSSRIGIRPPASDVVSRLSRTRGQPSFRRTVYLDNIWALPLSDFTGRFRDCSPTFYRLNGSQLHRLVPWLARELDYLLNGNEAHISYVIQRILELLTQYRIRSSEFREEMFRYLGERTEHFVHELYCFAATPYDLNGYDRNVAYTSAPNSFTVVNEVISSSETEGSADSDIVIVSSSEPADPRAGPSRLPPRYSNRQHSSAPPPPGPSRIPEPSSMLNNISKSTAINVIPIEMLSQSDSDDDSSEVMVVGYIKPPQDRTPEVVDLLGSDSDIIVQDTEPEPSQGHNSQETKPHVSLVKLCLKKRKEVNYDSDSDDSTYKPPPRKRRKRTDSSSTTTSDTCRTTPSPASSSHSMFILSNESNASSESISSLYNSGNRRKKFTKKKQMLCKRGITKEKYKEKKKKQSSKRRNKEKITPNSNAENANSRKYKSISGKGVKSSKKTEGDSAIATADAAVQAAPALDLPSTSGIANKRVNESEKSRDRTATRESRRLRSVVNIVNSHGKPNSSCTGCGQGSSHITPVIKSTKTKICKNVIKKDMGRKSVITSSSKSKKVEAVSPRYGGHTIIKKDDMTDSEDDIPLNLSVQKRGLC